jgi:hypothetical protein
MNESFGRIDGVVSATMSRLCSLHDPWVFIAEIVEGLIKIVSLIVHSNIDATNSSGFYIGCHSNIAALRATMTHTTQHTHASVYRQTHSARSVAAEPRRERSCDFMFLLRGRSRSSPTIFIYLSIAVIRAHLLVISFPRHRNDT